jgi:hypothetical protein
MEKGRVSNYDPNKKNYERQHDPEHVSRNKKQQSKQNSRFNGYDDEPIRGGKRARAKKPSAQQMMAPIKIETAYMAGDTITVRDLTEKIGKPAGEIIKKLFMLGNMATINSEIDFDTAQLVCSDFEITLDSNTYSNYITIYGRITADGNRPAANDCRHGHCVHYSNPDHLPVKADDYGRQQICSRRGSSTQEGRTCSGSRSSQRRGRHQGRHCPSSSEGNGYKNYKGLINNS